MLFSFIDVCFCKNLYNFYTWKNIELERKMWKYFDKYFPRMFFSSNISRSMLLPHRCSIRCMILRSDLIFFFMIRSIKAWKEVPRNVWLVFTELRFYLTLRTHHVSKSLFMQILDIYECRDETRRTIRYARIRSIRDDPAREFPERERERKSVR